MIGGSLPVEVVTRATGFVKSASFRLNAAEQIAANQPAGLGHLLVPAPGLNRMIIPVWGCSLTQYRPAVFNFSPNWALNWRGVGGFGVAPTFCGFGAWLQTNIDTTYVMAQTFGSANLAKSTNNLENRAIVLTGNLPAFAGGAGSIMHVVVNWIEISVTV